MFLAQLLALQEKILFGAFVFTPILFFVFCIYDWGYFSGFKGTKGTYVTYIYNNHSAETICGWIPIIHALPPFYAKKVRYPAPRALAPSTA